MDYYTKRKKWFLENYKIKGPEDIYSLNGIDKEGHKEFVNNFSFILKLIDHDGDVLDLGCGNGLLLKFLIENSKYKLIPWGVDFLEKSIIQAKEKVLPEFKDNFFIENVFKFNFPKKFDYILSAPEYVSDTDFITYFNYCFDGLKSDGFLIFYIHIPNDKRICLKIEKQRLNTLNYMKRMNIQWIKFQNIMFGYICKKDTLKK